MIAENWAFYPRTPDTKDLYIAQMWGDILDKDCCLFAQRPTPTLSPQSCHERADEILK